MTDEKKYTEREVVERERKAFKSALWHMRHRIDPCGYGRAGAKVYNELVDRIDEFFPLPKRKVTRPRKVAYYDVDYRLVDGYLEASVGGQTQWMRAVNPNPTLQEMQDYPLDYRVMLADLLANPTEEVEVDDD